MDRAVNLRILPGRIYDVNVRIIMIFDGSPSLHNASGSSEISKTAMHGNEEPSFGFANSIGTSNYQRTDSQTRTGKRVNSSQELSIYIYREGMC